MLCHEISHELPGLAGIAAGRQRHAGRRGRPDVVNLVEEDLLGPVEVGGLDLGKLLQAVGSATPQQHRTGRLELCRLAAKLHLADLIDGDLLDLPRPILELNLICIRRRDAARDRAGVGHHPVGRLREGPAADEEGDDGDQEEEEKPAGRDRSAADGVRHGCGIPGRADGRHEAATGGSSSSASPRGLASPRSF